ncbi:hypothetical protein KFE26_23100 [Shewanella sp. M16]|uniref:hypothetical protein n=1 Tax=Shewanella sp. M16 TaxID=2830837 RepID=UPI001BB0A9F7|nr:hypothetical protein [Shewanella sp. M16]MBS0045139.1 hypothetical protein [Shewanella sp. M16]
MTDQEMETAIIDKTIDALLAAGLHLAVYDGEEITTPITTDKAVIVAALGTTELDYLCCYASPTAVRTGFVMLVYGNAGYEVICDYTTNLEDVLAQVNEYAEQLAEAA